MTRKSKSDRLAWTLDSRHVLHEVEVCLFQKMVQIVLNFKFLSEFKLEVFKFKFKGQVQVTHCATISDVKMVSDTNSYSQLCDQIISLWRCVSRQNSECKSSSDQLKLRVSYISMESVQIEIISIS